MAEEEISVGLDHDEPYPKAWAIASVMTGFFSVAVGIYAFCFLGCLLCSTGTYRDVPKAIRKQSYNVYLIFLIIPDAAVNLLAGLAKIYEGFNDGRYMPLCLARNGLNYFYYFCNLWLNAVVAHQVFRLVVGSYQRKKVAPPELSTALTQIALVYVCCGLLAGWYIAEVPWSPFRTIDEEYCHTNVGSDTIGSWLATGIAMVVIAPPVIYVTYVYWVVWKKKLLPKSGRTRALFVYFLRIMVVYLAFYVPNAGVAVIYMHLPNTQRTAQFWTLWLFTILVPLQCIVTVRMACAKEDIGQAVANISHEVSRRFPSAFFSTRSMNFSPAKSGTPSSTLQQTTEGHSSEVSSPLPASPGGDSKTKNKITTEGVLTTSEWDLDDEYEETDAEQPLGC